MDTTNGVEWVEVSGLLECAAAVIGRVIDTAARGCPIHRPTPDCTRPRADRPLTKRDRHGQPTRRGPS